MDIPLAIFYSSLATVALMIIVGFFAGKRQWIDEHTNKTLINLLLLIAMPCALFGSFPGKFSTTDLTSFLYGLAGGAAVLLVAIIVARLLFRKKKDPKHYFEYQFAFIFNNASFLGLPLITTIHGGEVPISYAGFIIVFNLALFSYGTLLFQEKIDWKDFGKSLLNPNIIAVILGAIFFLSSWQLPQVLGDGVKYLAMMMTPMSLLCIGYMLSRANLRQIIRRKMLVLTAVAQLILGPIITFGILWLLKAPADVIFVLVLIQALPTATSLGLFAEKYHSNSDTEVSSASELVAISTLLSAATLPLVIWGISYLV